MKAEAVSTMAAADANPATHKHCIRPRAPSATAATRKVMEGEAMVKQGVID